MKSNPIFIYPYWMKFLGLGLIILGLVFFVNRILTYDIFDLASFSSPAAFGFIFIFFSKEIDQDERIVYLKYKALAFSIPATAFVISLINYYFNFNGYSIETDSWYSISAFEYLTLALIFGQLFFYVLKRRE